MTESVFSVLTAKLQIYWINSSVTSQS